MVKYRAPRVLVVVPAYRVRAQVLDVISKSLDVADHVLVVDDACPDESGKHVEREFSQQKRVSVIFSNQNLGVGGALKKGFDWALARDFEIVVKVDGDGQMDPSLVPELIGPLVNRTAEYAKGNRFDSPRTVRQMPFARLLGNAALSLFSKASSGYWSVSDPTNGFIAIKRETLAKLEHDLLSDTFFFESDLLFRLSIVKARISEMPMAAVYGEERSNLKIARVLVTFPFLYFRNLVKRIAYNYYVREWSIGSLELPVGIALMLWGLWFGLTSYFTAQAQGIYVTAGQAVATSIGIILGFQLLLSFIAQDVQSEPKAGMNR